MVFGGEPQVSGGTRVEEFRVNSKETRGKTRGKQQGQKQIWWQIHSRKTTWTQKNLSKGDSDPASEELLRNICFYYSWISSSSNSCLKKTWNVQKRPLHAAHKQNIRSRIDFKGHSRAEENQLRSGKKARAHILQTFKYQLRIIILSDFCSPLGAFSWSTNNMQ